MPRRTMTFGRITVKESRITDSEFELDDIQGLDLLEEFSSWASGLPIDHFKDLARQRYGTKPTVDRYSRFTLLSMRTGHFGTAGDLVIDVSSHGTSYETLQNDSSTVETRCGLLVPPNSKIGLFFMEHQGHNACGSRIFSSFEAHLKDKAGRTLVGRKGNPLKLVIDKQTLVSGSAWLERASLEKVSVMKYEKPIDVSDSPVSVPLTYSRTLLPPKGVRWLPKWMKDILFDTSISGSSQIGFPTDEEFDEIVATLSDGEQTKTMVIGKEKSPAIRKLLNDDGQPALDAQMLIHSFDQDAQEYYSSQELDWSYKWTRTTDGQ
ncbi:hypothetical protein [Glutamicibacter sp. ZJUTW]|uniref:hypothetical protein n=1 Tax=Glutamicibacter sp. ZJUTW TaxID=1155384 RepID=UPI0011F2F521|nr:hypothetical protein [Glutamicibacter sp. ZJUTW]QEP08771.1 hypothetical protein F0M17_16800 [Glutamicibacter sp. ZJUTW]